MSCISFDRAAENECANCRVAASGTIKLKNCTACRLVKYCGVDCQKTHRKQHKKACKQRAAELKDERLYSQGHERPEGDFCPICTLLIPIPTFEHSAFNVCCMKRICRGCDMAARKRGFSGCPFCRSSHPANDDGVLTMVRARVNKKDPDAINFLALEYSRGLHGLQKGMPKAVRLWAEASELGSVDALSNLAVAYFTGDGVEGDYDGGIRLLEKAAMQGSVLSRHELGMIEGQSGNHSHEYRHFLISAKMGCNESVEWIKKIFMKGFVTKEQYSQALKVYQDVVEEMKSPERDEY